MHQTFYIDVDEEVNSIITRIRKSSAKYNILVIIQGALIMQSAVSLKLIKREADNLEKKIIIVTKDERAMAIAKKIGFMVKSSLEDLRGVISESNVLASQKVNYQEKERVVNAEKNKVENPDKRLRLNNLGSDSFVSTNRRMDSGLSSRDKIGMHKNVEASPDINVPENVGVIDKTKNDFSAEENDSFDKLFNDSPKIAEEKIERKSDAKGDSKFLWIFLLTIIILLLGIGGYFYLPKAEVTIFPKEEEQSFNLKLEISDVASEGISSGDMINLKSKIIEDENVLSLSFPATGQKGSSNQKSKGKIMIYNESSETSQVLVATTRFMTGDEKLFRLINTVTVPGMVVKDGKVEPGKIEAEIIADEAGESYNISEAEFRIPGFKGSSKYDKFYAKLSQETKGGGGDESGGGLKTVSGSDIEGAKIKTENQLKNQLKESIKNKLGDENVLLDNALSFEVVDYSVFPAEDSVTENFEYQVKIKVRAISFSASELEDKINSFVNNKLTQKSLAMEIISVNKEYGRADIDFGKKIIKADLRVKANAEAKIESEKITQYLVNKNKDEINSVLENFPGIKKIEASINPSFISNKFPRYQSRITVTVQETVK